MAFAGKSAEGKGAINRAPTGPLAGWGGVSEMAGLIPTLILTEELCRGGIHPALANIVAKSIITARTGRQRCDLQFTIGIFHFSF